jgi:hypothetical protein
MACRDAKRNAKLSQGQDAIISKAFREIIAHNVRSMFPTSEFDSAFKNIIECVWLPDPLPSRSAPQYTQLPSTPKHA